jgi:hypothetical protein
MDQAIRNKLRGVVTQCRRLLEDSVSQELQGKFGIYAARKDDVQVDAEARMTHLGSEERAARKDILDHFDHIKARGFKPREALDQLVREVAFTHLNRLCAYKMMEARQVYVGDQRFREAVSRGANSNGVKFYLAAHPDDERLFTSGQQDVAYQHFLDWLGGLLSEEIGVLFSPNDPANRLYPPQRVLDDVLGLINDESLADIWVQDETIGWVYQYFTPKELRDQARKESAAPRNSYELAFRNQFFTPRYVVEFLTDNTLGRIWYEMRKADTKLKDQCRYMVRRPTEVFLKDGDQPPKDASEVKDDLLQEELLKLPVYIPHRPKKDPRELKILDPACGSGHFLLYCFDLLLTIYEEAYADPDLGPKLKEDYPTLEALRQDVPHLILAHNLHGIDIDLRATQIAALALWLRCQRTYQDMGLKKDRLKITRSNVVCAEPMPGEQSMLEEFVGQLEPKLLGQLVEVVFDKMKLAGEAGSLLKIEEEIRDAVAEARRQWLTGPVSIQRSLFDDDQPVVRQQRFDFSGITDAQFFEQAEAKVIDALRNYAEMSNNDQRLQRHLFTEDAVRGFAFVDLCNKRFDVVLMNPPFGEAVPTTRAILGTSYTDAAADLGACFIDRAISLLSENGLAGAITSRTYLTNEGLVEWRRFRLLGGNASLAQFADLGFGVLDDAKVEAAAYVVQRNSVQGPVLFHNVLHSREKAHELHALVASTEQVVDRQKTAKPLSLFQAVPGCVLCYWLPAAFLRTCLRLPNLRALKSEARVGLQTGDNDRFVRAVWEVTSDSIGSSGTWAFFAKGGEYEPFYDDIHLVVLWENEGHAIKNFCGANGRLLSRPQNLAYYFNEGITYPDRTTSDFSPRIMPTGIIFSSTGFALFPPDRNQLLGYLGAAYTRPFKVLVEPFVGSGDFSASGSMARHYRPGVLNVLPNYLHKAPEEICDLVERCIAKRIEHFRCDETARLFVHPFSKGLPAALSSAAAEAYVSYAVSVSHLLAYNRQLELAVLDTINSPAFEQELDYLYGAHPEQYSNVPSTEDIINLLSLSEADLIETARRVLGPSRFVFMKAYFADRRIELVCHILRTPPSAVVKAIRESNFCPAEKIAQSASALLSYGAGCMFGRWDVRAVFCEANDSPPDPFAPLPVCSPGMLQESNRLPSASPPQGYPLRINWEGIVVDDPEHSDDILRRVRDVLEVIWKDRADAIEKEVCEIFGVNKLRDYFRKPGKGGFWDDHVSRYSKSRRKAPIYWLLQSSKKNYALWLYYHRLDKDLLFKALVNYVEPKIRLEESRLETLLTQKAAAGGSGRDAKRLGKEVERQEEFLSELRDFEDKLRRAANLHLEPDLDDGVVLNISPLWELVPWKEAKNYWEELLKGKYEWSSIGKQLRQKELVK